MAQYSSQLTTEWICVASQGMTLNGTLIPSGYLANVASSYSPTVYTALIKDGEDLPSDNLGEVQALRCERHQGEERLYVRLCPNARLVELNRQGLKLFCDIDVIEDFRGTGKPYLKTLTVTDNPNHIGTDRLRFRTKGKVGARMPFSMTVNKRNWYSAISLN